MWQSLDDLTKELYRVRYIENLRYTVRYDGIPQEMISEVDETSSGWVKWELIWRSGEIDPDLPEGYSAFQTIDPEGVGRFFSNRIS